MSDAEKNVVYLLGAGASHAELRYLAPLCTGILMNDIVYDIPPQLSEANEDLIRIKNIIDSPKQTIDIEQIITLYEHDVDKRHHRAANELRMLFRKELTSRIITVLEGQPKFNGCDFHSGLLTPLFDMHNIPNINERLSAVITTNYDDLIERALQNVCGGFNYSFELINNSETFDIEQPIPLLKLHGSFSWTGKYPIVLEKPVTGDNGGVDDDFIIWAPPGTNKSKADYPFSSIWNTAREILNCDILRIIGCSLSRNDWLLITLIHDAQVLREGSRLKIQLLDYPEHAFNLYKNLPYLDIEYIPFDKSFIEFCDNLYSITIPQNRFSEYSSEDIKQLDSEFSDKNMFHLWLEERGYYLKNRERLDLATKKHFFEKFYLKEESK